MSVEALTKTVLPVQSEPRSKGERTRERILDLAYDAVIRKGFAATSIDELVEAAGITKSGFFYHFRDKNDLAHQMLERFMAQHAALLDTLRDRSRELTEDPLQSLLVFMKFYAEVMTDLVAQHPGCLVAAVTFQDQSFDREVNRMNVEGVLDWRGRFAGWLAWIAETHPPHAEVDFDDLADGLTVVTIGGIVACKALGDPALVGRQVMNYREYIRLLFSRR
jgi:AcrR family transcriptional regulator